jgi:hypothetical protein
MSWRRALRHPAGPASATVRHVLLTASTYASKDGGDMYPSIETLSIGTALNNETVRRAMKRAVDDGFVLREERDRRGPFGGVRYSYHAALPDNWLAENQLDAPWEQDPNFVSERLRRHRAKQGHVPTLSSDVRKATVPVVSASRPCPASVVSLSTVGRVPYQDSTTSSGISSGTSLVTSKEEKRSIDTTKNPFKSPSTESRKPKNDDFENILDRVAKVLIEFGSTASPIHYDDTTTLARITRVSDNQVPTAVSQLRDRGRLPPQQQGEAVGT